MRALLIVAHGSRRQASNQEVVELAQQLAQSKTHDYDLVTAAFLELADTLIPDGIEHCVRSGASEIIVVPYFLNSGKHVTRDIPDVITAIKVHYPDIRIRLTPHIGAASIMPDLVLETAAF